ncbi:NB-ARC domain-containing protein [Abeliophyllum distichum]|uniref:NB-ARC domain-containing protein n=1 Tax=Abeliophyllum distichum TaxID=126358 RepID=A0ABD1VER4_9LAMI
MSERIGFSIAGKLSEYAVDPILRKLKYLFRYKSNIQNLRNKVKDLENKITEVQLRVDEAYRNTEVIGPSISEWLQKAVDLKKEIDEVLNTTTSSEMQCLFNRCPNLKSRYLLSRKGHKENC